MTRNRYARRLLTSLAASSGIALAMVGLSPAVMAHAADRTTASDRVTLHVATSTAPAAPATALPNPYGCYGQSDYPHISQHYPDRVAAEARTVCTSPVPYEFVESWLYRHDCILFVCWWTQVGHDSSSQQSFGRVTDHPSYTCNGQSNHDYLVQSYHEVKGYDGNTYTGNTAQQSNNIPCG
jgi:hypothetical protein